MINNYYIHIKHLILEKNTTILKTFKRNIHNFYRLNSERYPTLHIKLWVSLPTFDLFIQNLANSETFRIIHKIQIFMIGFRDLIHVFHIVEIIGP